MTPDQNSLNLLKYKFKLSRTPEIEYRAQTVSVPGFSIGSADMPTRLGLRVPFAGNAQYEDFSVTFLVGENLRDYLEIFNWMTSIAHPNDLSEYPRSEADTVSDVSVLVLNSSNRGIFDIKFTDAFPISLTSLDFDSTLSDVQYAQATVTFRYNRYYFKAT